VQQFVSEGHLRWDSLGEFLALAVALEDLGTKTNNADALILAQTLDRANGLYLDHAKSPSSKVHEIDNRGSHFYLAMYWAQAIAAQEQNPVLALKFAGLARQLGEQEGTIVAELNAAQGQAVDIGGYYHPDAGKTSRAMRPSATLNRVMANE
jgi:isocitrate dehydrogenase